MAYSETTALRKLARMSKKIRILQGGTSAGKTIAVLLYLIALAQTDKQKTLTSVVSESIPHLKRGALRDFKNILQAHNYWKDSNWNATDSIYTFETGSQIEFFSTDNGDKLRGGRRDRCFMNEANNCTLDAFDQLEVRTKEFVILDYNPTNEFWALTDVKPTREDVDFVILTYKDNEALSPEIIQSIEARRERVQWWRVYGEGQLGEVEGRIYTGWVEIEQVPHEATLERYGLDFGYSTDPTAIVAVYKYNGGIILDEITYLKGLSNKRIAEILLAQGRQALVVADSAEPKSIDEIASYGISIVPCQKGADSIRQGIQVVQEQRISYTKRSNNLKKEYSNFLWRRDKDGKTISPNVPEQGFDHICFTGDTIVEGKRIDTIGTMTGIKDVYEYELAGTKIKATPEHPVLTQRGLVCIDTLRYNDIIWQKSLFMTISGGIDTQTLRNGLIKVTTEALKRALAASRRDYIDINGLKNTELYRKDLIYITLMATPSIMKLLIYSALAVMNTLRVILLKKSSLLLVSTLRWLLEKRLNGLTLQKGKLKEKKWVLKMPSIYIIDQWLICAANYVERNIKQKTLWFTNQDGVTTTASRKRYVGRVPVWGLKTKSGLYQANGVMVSNCDALRYAITDMFKNPEIEDGEEWDSEGLKDI